MTVYEDALTKAKTYDVTGSIDPNDKRLHRDITTARVRQGEALYPASLAKGNEVQTIRQFASVGIDGIYSLSFTLADGTTFSLGLPPTIGTNAAALTTSINAAANGTVPGWTNGDIVVTGGPLTVADFTLTFSGDSVKEANHGQTTIDDISVVSEGGSYHDPAELTVTNGSPSDRFWFGTLKSLGVLTGDDPGFGDAPAGQYSVIPRDTVENYPSNHTIKRLIKEATVQEGQDWEAELFPLFGF